MSGLDLIGKRVGRLTVVEEVEPRFRSYARNPNHKTRVFKCICDCGNEAFADGGNLRSAHTQSCGCRQRDNGAKVGNLPKPIKHGMCGTPEYRAWHAMIQRCTNPNATRYERYGGRGIVVCDRWAASFENFFSDVGLRPSSGHSIDRYPDNDGNYEPHNVRWATSGEQRRNQSSNRLVIIDGREICVTDAAKLLGLKITTVRTRMYLGQSPEEALQLRR